jgi:serine protease Do
VLVQDFEGDSPAQRAGLREGDVIVAVNGQAVEGVGELQRRVTGYKPGETVTLEVIRGGQSRSVRVPLIEASLAAEATTAAAPTTGRGERPGRPAEPASVSADKLGIQVAPLTQQLATQYEYRQPGGVVITNADRYGPMGRRGFGPGWKITAADGQQIADVRTLQRIVDGKKAGDLLSMVLENPTGQRTILNLRIENPRQ